MPYFQNRIFKNHFILRGGSLAKKVMLYDYLLASKLTEIRVVDTIEADFSEENKNIILHSTNNPEKITILKDNFNALSDDTKQLIKFILDIPDEALEILNCEGQDKISLPKTRRLFKNIFGKNRARKIFREIKKWLNELRF